MKYTNVNLIEWFNIINDSVFGGLLNKPVIHLLSNNDCKKVMKYHFNESGNIFGITIGINNGWIGLNDKQTKAEFIDTLVHELCHVWQWQNKTQLGHGFDFNYYMMLAKSVNLIK